MIEDRERAPQIVFVVAVSQHVGLVVQTSMFMPHLRRDEGSPAR